MRGNQAHHLMLEDQLDGKPMEPRIARIESDVAHINKTLAEMQLDVRELRDGLKAANESIVEVRMAVAGLDRKLDDKTSALDRKVEGGLSALDKKLDDKISALDRKVEDRISSLDEKLVAQIHATSSALESKLIKWMIGTAIAIVGTMLAFMGVALAIANAVFGSKVP